jgi:hypothetical protein
MVSDNQIAYIRDAQTAVEMWWSNVRTIYQRQGMQSMIANHYKISTIKYEGIESGPLQDHLNIVPGLCRRFEVRKRPAIRIQAASVHTEKSAARVYLSHAKHFPDWPHQCPHCYSRPSGGSDVLNYFIQIDSHASRTPLSMSNIGGCHVSRRLLSNLQAVTIILTPPS